MHRVFSLPLVPLLAAVALLALLLTGCSSTTPAPVYGWNWSGPVPDGYYQVRRGDTLGQVAQRLGISSSKLAAWNRLRPPYTLYADTLLRVKPPDGTAPRPPAPARAAEQVPDVSRADKGREQEGRTSGPRSPAPGPRSPGGVF